jgi:hypothetical protein
MPKPRAKKPRAANQWLPDYAAALAAVEAKALSHYVGFNVIRVKFAEEKDALEYLRLMGELNRLYPFTMYGGADQWPRVETNHDGTFEVYRG